MGHIKLWDNILDCPKLANLSDIAYRCWSKLLVTALRNGGRNGELPLLETLVFRMRMPEEVIVSCIKEMHRCGLVEPCPDNPIGGMPYKIHDWDDWQLPKDASAAERQARWRNNQALRNAQRNAQHNEGVTVDVTPVSIEALKEEANTPPNPRKRGKPDKPAVVLPDWVPLEDWNAFIAMRMAKRAKPTEHAKDLLVRELAKLKAAGHDPRAVLQQSTRSNWTDLYPIAEPRANGKPAPKPPVIGLTDDQVDEIKRRRRAADARALAEREAMAAVPREPRPAQAVPKPIEPITPPRPQVTMTRDEQLAALAKMKAEANKNA